jgi:hypothetical protein
VLWRWSAFTLVDFRGNAIGPFTMHQLLAGRGGFGVKGVPSHSALMRINVGCSPQVTKSLIIANDAKGHSLPNCFVREMSVHHPIVDIRADIAGRRFGPISRHYLGTSIYDFGGQDVVSRQRPPDTLELKVPNGLHRYGVFHRHQNTGTDQNLARLGFVA